MGPDIAAPAINESAFVAADGAELPIRMWSANDTELAVIIAVHGFNDYSDAFTAAGEFWATRGITTVAYDQRGFGQAPDRGIWSTPETQFTDLKTILRLLREEHADQPVVALGVSMGGAVLLNAYADQTTDEPSPDGIVLVSPAIWHGGPGDPFYRTLSWLGAHTFPYATATGRGFNRMASDNIEMLRSLGQDPLVIKETRFDAVYGLFDLMRKGWISASNLNGPVLTLYGEKDEIVPPESLHSLDERLPMHDSIWYAEGYHMLLRDLQAESVWQDIADWVLDLR